MRRLLLLALVLALPMAAAEPTPAPDVNGTVEDTRSALDKVVGGVKDAGADVGGGLADAGHGIGDAASGLGGALAKAARAVGRAVAATGAIAVAAAAGTFALAGDAGGLAADATLAAFSATGAALASLGTVLAAGLVGAAGAVAQALAAAAAALAMAAGLAWSLASTLRPQRMPEPAFAAVAATSLAASAAAGGYTLLAWLKKVGWLAPAGLAGFSRIDDAKVLEHPIRSQLFQAIQATPGIHASALGRVGDVGWGTVVHHLDRLERAKLVTTRRVGGQKCYFENGGRVSRQDMAVAGAVRSPTAGHIAAYVQDHPMTSQKQMAGSLGISAALASFHVKKLVHLGVLQKVRQGKETLLTATEAVRRVHGTLQPVPLAIAAAQVA